MEWALFSLSQPTSPHPVHGAVVLPVGNREEPVQIPGITAQIRFFYFWRKTLDLWECLKFSSARDFIAMCKGLNCLLAWILEMYLQVLWLYQCLIELFCHCHPAPAWMSTAVLSWHLFFFLKFSIILHSKPNLSPPLDVKHNVGIILFTAFIWNTNNFQRGNHWIHVNSLILCRTPISALLPFHLPCLLDQANLQLEEFEYPSSLTDPSW